MRSSFEGERRQDELTEQKETSDSWNVTKLDVLKFDIFKYIMRSRYSGKVKCPCGFKDFFLNAKLMPEANIHSSDIIRSVKFEVLY